MTLQDADEREDSERAVPGAAAGGHPAAGDERDPGKNRLPEIILTRAPKILVDHWTTDQLFDQIDR